MKKYRTTSVGREAILAAAVLALPSILSAQRSWQWEPLGQGGGPEPRSHAVVAWTGKALLVWGGLPFGINMPWLDDGWIYDPAADGWQPMSTADSPGARQFPVGVWTGRELIIWGGHTPRNPPDSLRTGARYDPSTDTWQVMSLTDAPRKRGGHTMAWTGTEVIVWGGYDFDESDELADGGRYNPATDSWTPMTNVNAPSARASHTAVWTGMKLIVWGGGRFSGSWSDIHWEHAGDFGLYDSESDEWHEGPLAGAPVARSDHSAVWTGTRMLVWGGWAGRNFEQDRLGDGGAYDPGTGSWSPIPLAEAPAARAGHACVWTGRDMLVWGGSTEDPGQRQSGGCFNPATASWSPLPTAGAPAGGKPGCAAWTGEALYTYYDRLARVYETGPYAVDGIPDEWQYRFFGPRHPDGSAGRDPDGDRQDNILEFLAGTIPTDPLSRFELSISAGWPSGDLRFPFSPHQPGRIYRLEHSGGSSPFQWLPVEGARVENIDGPSVLLCPRVHDSPQFYRVAIEAGPP